MLHPEHATLIQFLPVADLLTHLMRRAYAERTNKKMRFVQFNIEHTYFEMFILMIGVDSIGTLITDMSELLFSWPLLNFIFFF